MNSQRDIDEDDRDRRVLHRVIDEAFDDAVLRVGIRSRTYAIAGETLQVEFAGDSLVAPLTRALAHLSTDSSDKPTATIRIWDSRSTGRKLPMLANSLLRLLDRTWLDDRDLRGEINGYSDGTIRAAYYGPQLLALYDTTTRSGIFWLDDAEALPWYEPGAPFRVILDWIVSSPTRQLVHAGAIASASGGVLLGGAGGSGKSTTALACLRSGIGSPAGTGLQYVSDDYVIIDRTSEPIAWGPYSTAKVKGTADLERFPTLATGITNLARAREQTGHPHAEKPMLFVHEQHPDRCVASVPLRALVFPKYLALDECTIAEVPRTMAFKMLAPSTIQQVPSARSQAMRCMRSLAMSLPSYALGLPTDAAKIPAAIEEIIRRAGSANSGERPTP